MSRRPYLVTAAVVIGLVCAATAYALRPAEGNALLTSLCFFILLPGIIAQGGVHVLAPKPWVLVLVSSTVDTGLAVLALRCWVTTRGSRT